MFKIITAALLSLSLAGCLSVSGQARLQQTVQKVCASGDTYHQAYNVWLEQGVIPVSYQKKAAVAWANFDRFCATPQLWSDPVGAALTAGTLYLQIQSIVKEARAR